MRVIRKQKYSGDIRCLLTFSNSDNSFHVCNYRYHTFLLFVSVYSAKIIHNPPISDHSDTLCLYFHSPAAKCSLVIQFYRPLVDNCQIRQQTTRYLPDQSNKVFRDLCFISRPK